MGLAQMVQLGLPGSGQPDAPAGAAPPNTAVTAITSATENPRSRLIPGLLDRVPARGPISNIDAAPYGRLVPGSGSTGGYTEGSMTSLSPTGSDRTSLYSVAGVPWQS